MIKLKNLGTVNKNYINVNGLEIWFSYETPVAFQKAGERYVRENEWSTTTGRFLNELEPDKNKRVKSEEFEKMLRELEIS